MGGTRNRTDSPARRITTAAVGVLAFTALVAGGGVFALMHQLHQRTIEGELLGALQDRRELLDSQLRLHESRAEDVAQYDELRNALAGKQAEALEAAIRGAVIEEVRAVTVLSAAGDVLAGAGTPVRSSAFSLPLSTPLASELLWDGRCSGPASRCAGTAARWEW